MLDGLLAVNLDSSDSPADLNKALKCNHTAQHAAEGCVLAKSSSVKGGPAWSPNHLYFGDNIDWLEKLEPESVDLVYLDPPFNSKAQYNVIYETPDEKRGTAQAKVFRDSWTWEDEATDCFNRVLARGGKPRLRELLEGVKLLMRMSDSWTSFMEKMDEYYPKLGETLRLPLRGGALRLTGPEDTNPK